MDAQDKSFVVSSLRSVSYYVNKDCSIGSLWTGTFSDISLDEVMIKQKVVR